MPAFTAPRPCQVRTSDPIGQSSQHAGSSAKVDNQTAPGEPQRHFYYFLPRIRGDLATECHIRVPDLPPLSLLPQRHSGPSQEPATGCREESAGWKVQALQRRPQHISQSAPCACVVRDVV